MSSTQRLSPRQVALDAVLETRALLDYPRISISAWDKLVTLAWENRSRADRRDVRREIRSVLLDEGRGEESADAADRT